MKELKRTHALMVIASLVFAVSTQVPGVGLNGVIVEGTQGSSDDGNYSFGDGRFIIEGKTPKGFPEIESLYLEGGSFNLAPDKKRMIAVKPTSLQGELN